MTGTSQIDHDTGFYVPYSFHAFFNVPQEPDQWCAVRRGLRFIVLMQEIQLYFYVISKIIDQLYHVSFYVTPRARK